MITVDYTYANKQFKLAPYTTAQEKDLLLMSSIGSEDLDCALEICNVDLTIIKQLTNAEKISMLYKQREISVGAEVNVTFNCAYCATKNENVINIENIIKSGNITNAKIIEAYDVLTDNNIDKFTTEVIEELDLDEYQELFTEIKTSCVQFDFKKPAACLKCTKLNYIDISTPEFVLSVLSEDSLISIYQTYNDLIFFGKYSKLDIDSMYPFERTILMSLLNKTREDLNK